MFHASWSPKYPEVVVVSASMPNPHDNMTLSNRLQVEEVALQRLAMVQAHHCTVQPVCDLQNCVLVGAGPAWLALNWALHV